MPPDRDQTDFGRRCFPRKTPAAATFKDRSHQREAVVIHGRPTVDGFANAEGRDGGPAGSRQERYRLLVDPLLTAQATAFPLHIPSEPFYTDGERLAVVVTSRVSYATGIVWETLIPRAPPIAAFRRPREAPLWYRRRRHRLWGAPLGWQRWSI